MKTYIHLLAAACLLASCAPKSVVRLRPVAEETRFTDGLEAIKQEQHDLKIVTMFENTPPTNGTPGELF
ncbi:MAG: hypothetical protein LH606_15225 [Cytophagaceae bacterium]|nr:hypothetical protein [Cytophagaceae bacterium]